MTSGKRRRRIPNVAVPPGLSAHNRKRLVSAIDRLEEAVAAPTTATGARDQIQIVREIIDEFTELRPLLVAWLVERADVTTIEAGEAAGVSASTAWRWSRSSELLDRLDELG